MPRADGRPTWDELFLAAAETFSTAADCTRRKVGALIVDADNRLLAQGFNGAPRGEVGCLSGGCPRGKLTYEELAGMSDYDSGPGRCIAIHAEVNAILNANGPIRGATMYVNHPPCGPCTRSIAGAGISRVVWPEGEMDPVAEHVRRTGA